ncbi:unnamed protein product [Timema podura]|uniref:Uncharacterized protein n=1 Tax=Timema podura TaxID=61482 RepID=A0ABN7NE97_TIMPD|nr:unnamed protein product [Timema podura]
MGTKRSLPHSPAIRAKRIFSDHDEQRLPQSTVAVEPPSADGPTATLGLNESVPVKELHHDLVFLGLKGGGQPLHSLAYCSTKGTYIGGLKD